MHIFSVCSFSVGYIFSASHQLPSSVEFLSYDKVRLHWKKQVRTTVHYFALTDLSLLTSYLTSCSMGSLYQRGRIYSTKCFSNQILETFSGELNLHRTLHTTLHPCFCHSYPGCCVCKAHPLVFPSKDTDVVASAFIADIHARVPSICGEPVRFSSKALTPFAQLHLATSYQALSNARPAPMKSSMQPPGVSVPFRQTPISSSSNPDKGPWMGSGNTPPNGRGVQPQQSQLVPSLVSENHSQASNGTRVVPIFQPKACTGSQKQQHGRNKESSHEQRSSNPTALNFKPTFQSNRASATKNVPAQKREMQSASSHLKSVPSLMKGATRASPKSNSMQQFPGTKIPGEQRAQADPLLNSTAPPAKRPCLVPTATTVQQNSRQLQHTIQQIVPDISQPECLNTSHDGSFNESTAETRAPKQQPSKSTTNEVRLS